MGTKYPAIVNPWRNTWNVFTPFLAYPPEIRRVVYTTNMIESINYQLRKVTKTRAISRPRKQPSNCCISPRVTSPPTQEEQPAPEARMESVPQRTRHLLPRPNQHRLAMTDATRLHRRTDTPGDGVL